MIKLGGEGSLYKQLLTSLRQAIIRGDYQANEKLPSSRELACSLQLSRNIVVSCYEQLTAEGYIITRHGSGSYVDKEPIKQLKPLQNKKHTMPKPLKLSKTAKTSLKHWRSYALSREGKERRKQYHDGIEIDFQYGPVAVNEQLLADINRITRKSRNLLDSNYQSPAGLLHLRESIARYAQQNRGCQCHIDNIVITNGSQQALDLLARLLLEQGDAVIVEEPCYRGAAQAFTNAGATLIRCAVDESGLNLDNLPPSLKSNPARLIYTTPSHQLPTGAILSLPRRLRLLKWANEHHAYIIEDDYDSEYRYKGRPIESIQGLDQLDQTIYIGTFSKILSPALRIGYVILPPLLVESFIALKWSSDRHSPLLTQHILAEFIDSPLFGRHLKRMRKIYGKRRNTLIKALQKNLGDSVTIQGTNAGIHLLAWLNTVPPSEEEKLMRLASQQGLGIHTTTALYQQPTKKLGLLMGYGNLSTIQIEEGVERLANVIASVTHQ
ncbi:MAG: PLP-dependent aminotransferase family protein [Cocleimonas sp.]|nr:PLP-dependent aminotransferase family protein [Cocleimonas sp.]